MQKIKTVQPYKLYAKLAEAKPSVKRNIILAIVMIVVVCVFIPIVIEEIGMLLILPVMLVIVGPMFLYNPWLKEYYKPLESFDYIRDYAKGMIPRYMVKLWPILGFVIGIVGDIAIGMFPVCVIISTGVMLLYSFFAKNNAQFGFDKKTKMQLKQHQDVDFNAKIDLNVTYGINDKLFLSYQNFSFDQKRLEDGDYILGVSPLGIYFAYKKNAVEKLFVRFEEIEALGILPNMFYLKSVHNNELNIIVDVNQSLLVSHYKLFDRILTSVDEFLLNGSVASAPVERRRRVVTTSSTDITTPYAVPSTDGRAIDMDTTTETINESSDNTNRRVIDIEFTPEVVAELAQGSFIEANRSIDIF